jgi:hypothetical protein
MPNETTTTATPEVTTTESAVVETPATETPASETVEASTPAVTGNEELSVLRERLARYEQLVVSPEYAEFLAAKSRAVAPTPQAPKQYSAEEKQAFQDRLNNMTRTEFAAFVRDLTVDTVREQLFTPVVKSMVSEKVQNQIAEAATEFPDYWDYKQDMIKLSNANPGLNAKQVYHLAKVQRSPKPAPVGKPPVRKPSGEAPTGATASHKEGPATSFDAAFEKAFQKSGL